MYKFETPCIVAYCVSRPSKKIKSPYVADIKLLEDGCEYMAHSPALGLGNLIKPNSKLYVQKNTKENKTQYNIKGVYDEENETWVGSTPLDANRLFKWIYENGYYETGNAIKSEVKCGESRFDFCIERAHACEKKEYIEVKCVPLRKGEYSYFPEGYRKSKKRL